MDVVLCAVAAEVLCCPIGHFDVYRSPRGDHAVGDEARRPDNPVAPAAPIAVPGGERVNRKR